MIMPWGDREGWLKFVFCDDGRVVDDRERDGGWRCEHVEDTSGYVKSGVRLPRLGWEDLISV
jgi:hypothetical protein